MSILRRHAWVLALCLPGLALRGDVRAERDELVELEFGTSLSEGLEHFVLEWKGERPHPARAFEGATALEDATRAGELGLVELRRGNFRGGHQLELEVFFPFEDIRVLAVECLDPRSPRLIWREVSRGAGRTVFAEWTAASEELRVLEWGLDGRLREERETRAGAVMPHYLLELIRAGHVTAGEFEVFDPLLHDLETWELTTVYTRRVGDSVEYERTAELRREDGSLAGRYVFRGEELMRFAWQEGGAVARRIDEGEYAELRARWGLGTAEGAPPLSEGAESSEASETSESSKKGETRGPENPDLAEGAKSG